MAYYPPPTDPLDTLFHSISRMLTIRNEGFSKGNGSVSL